MFKAIKRYFIYKNYRKLKQAYLRYGADLQVAYDNAQKHTEAFLSLHCPLVNKNCLGRVCMFYSGYSIRYDASNWSWIKLWVESYMNKDYYCKPYVYQYCKCKLTK